MPSLAVQHTDAQLEQTAELHARAVAIEAVREAIDSLDIMRDRVASVDIGHLWAARMVLRAALATLDAWDAAYDAARVGGV